MQHIALTCIGSKHLKDGTNTQDSSASSNLGNVIIGVWADGAGSSKYSEHSSKFAVNLTLSSLKYCFNKDGTGYQKWFRKKAASRFGKIAYKVNKEIYRKVHKNNLDIKDFHTTLGAFVYTPEWLAAFSIGDGFLVGRSGDEYELLLRPLNGEYANATYFLTSKKPNFKAGGKYCSGGMNRQQGFQVLWSDKPYEFIAASTDGLNHLALSNNNTQPFNEFFTGVEAAFVSDPTKLYDWFFNNKELINRTSDDRTLILATL